MAISAAILSGEEGLLVTPAVSIPRRRASRTASTTYGVVPEAAMPTTVSDVPIPCAARSAQPCRVSSSAPSTGVRSARSPPAMIPMTTLGGMPNVGGISEASSTPSLPLVPAPI